LGRQVLNDSQNGSNVTVVGFEYAYNLFGNRLTDDHLHKSDESETYSYDTAQRFTNYERGVIGSSPVFTQGYTLDALANWSSFNNNGSAQSRTHDSMNAITAMGTQSVNYDVKGNQTSNINGNTYYWDELNRLVEIKNISNSTIALYYYNTDNLRVEKITAGGTEQYYYCGPRVCVETDGSQSVTKEYIHGGQYIDEIITVISVGDPYYYLYDLRFNMYALVDDLANILERARYEGYGKQELMDDSFALIGSPLVDQPYSYTGQRLDTESGLQYYRARYFDNDLGRFINRDPIGYVDGLNLYQGYFVLNGVDPYGLDDITSCPVPAPAPGNYLNWGAGTGGTLEPIGVGASYPASQGNCLRYALNDPFKAGEPHTVRPNKKDEYYLPLGKDKTCDEFKKDMKTQFPTIIEPDKNGDCPKCYYKIALVIRPPTDTKKGDFHFYRQNPDGTWSDKRGTDGAVRSNISDPVSDAQVIGYSRNCGNLCVPNSGVNVD
jgi:RHS repeat-associated protein